MRLSILGLTDRNKQEKPDAAWFTVRVSSWGGSGSAAERELGRVPSSQPGGGVGRCLGACVADA